LAYYFKIDTTMTKDGLGNEPTADMNMHLKDVAHQSHRDAQDQNFLQSGAQPPDRPHQNLPAAKGLIFKLNNEKTLSCA
jgi:hypothetical protein